MAVGEGKNRRQTTVGKGALGRGMRIATGAERPRNDRSRKNLRVIPRPVRRLVVGSEPSAASGRGSEVSEWPRSKFPASAVRQRRNFGHRNRVIRNTPAQIQRGTDCHSQCAHWLRNDRFYMWSAVRRDDVGIGPYGWVIDGAVCGGTQGSRPTEWLERLRRAGCPQPAARKPSAPFRRREGSESSAGRLF